MFRLNALIPLLSLKHVAASDPFVIPADGASTPSGEVLVQAGESLIQQGQALVQQGGLLIEAETSGSLTQMDSVMEVNQGAPVFLEPVFNAGTQKSPIEMPVDYPFKWLIVENDPGSVEGTLANPPPECDPTVPGYPTGCEWPSLRHIKAHAPIYASGDYTEWSNVTALMVPDVGKYMVTVMAEGYKLCGGYFEVTDTSSTDPLTVKMICQPHPLPLGTIRMLVFRDSAPCNGQYDPGEELLPDFGIG